jgi:hypothetical protein
MAKVWARLESKAALVLGTTPGLHQVEAGSVEGLPDGVVDMIAGWVVDGSQEPRTCPTVSALTWEAVVAAATAGVARVAAEAMEKAKREADLAAKAARDAEEDMAKGRSVCTYSMARLTGDLLARAKTHNAERTARTEALEAAEKAAREEARIARERRQWEQAELLAEWVRTVHPEHADRHAAGMVSGEELGTWLRAWAIEAAGVECDLAACGPQECENCGNGLDWVHEDAEGCTAREWAVACSVKEAVKAHLAAQDPKWEAHLLDVTIRQHTATCCGDTHTALHAIRVRVSVAGVTVAGTVAAE